MSGEIHDLANKESGAIKLIKKLRDDPKVELKIVSIDGQDVTESFWILFGDWWHETPNLHFCTINDFIDLCDEIGINIEIKAIKNPLEILANIIAVTVSKADSGATSVSNKFPWIFCMISELLECAKA